MLKKKKNKKTILLKLIAAYTHTLHTHSSSVIIFLSSRPVEIELIDYRNKQGYFNKLLCPIKKKKNMQALLNISIGSKISYYCHC